MNICFDFFIDPILGGLADALIVPLFNTLTESIVPAVAEPLMKAAGSLLKILLQQIVDNLNPLTPVIKALLMPGGSVVNDVFKDSFDVFMPPGYIPTPSGLGLEEQTNGWNPENSPKIE